MSQFVLNEATDFEDIIGVLLSNWKTLRLAIEHCMGGSYEIMQCKIKDLIQNIHNCLKKKSDDLFNICDIIKDVMDVGFDIGVELCDTEDLCRDICRFFIDWTEIPQKRKTVLDELENMTIKIPIQKIPLEHIGEQLMINDFLVSSGVESD